MAVKGPRYSKEEFRRRGELLYERSIRELIDAREDPNKFVAIDIETGAFEVDADEMAASDRLAARIADPQIWLRRVGSPYARCFGSSLRRTEP